MRIELLDLPGTYSMAALSPDELLVGDVLAGRGRHARPDALLIVVDASNLRRNLYLVSQLLEYEIPTVIALNMIDVARGRGLVIRARRLAKELGVPVVPVVATQPGTLDPLVDALRGVADLPPSAPQVALPAPLQQGLASLPDIGAYPERLRLLIDEDGATERRYLHEGGSAEALRAARGVVTAAGGQAGSLEAESRYRWADAIIEQSVQRAEGPVRTWSERLDRVMTHRIGGVAILLVVLFLVFQSVFTWAGPAMDAIDGLFGGLSEWVAPYLPAGAVRSLVTDGLIAGVGGVLIFLPQILILFAVIAVLEDCGYLARAAYMMDQLMRGFGLTGRAFIPLLSSFACAVPAIMGTRAIPDRRERFTTILAAPFMSCSARLPVYVLMISAFVAPVPVLGTWLNRQGVVMFAMYLVGVAAVIPFAWVLRRTAFRGPAPGFLLELPPYRVPRPRAIWQRVRQAGYGFLVRAGTIILVVNIAVWALGYFPHSAEVEQAVRAEAAAGDWSEERLEQELAGAHLRNSYLGRTGPLLEPLVRPLGWDWRIGVATLASFPAREVIIATLGTLYNLGGDTDEESPSLRDALRSATWPDTGEPVFDLPVALSVMVFFALCAQCSATLVAVGREMRSWAWPVGLFFFMTAVAYAAAWAVYHVARGGL